MRERHSIQEPMVRDAVPVIVARRRPCRSRDRRRSATRAARRAPTPIRERRNSALRERSRAHRRTPSTPVPQSTERGRKCQNRPTRLSKAITKMFVGTSDPMSNNMVRLAREGARGRVCREGARNRSRATPEDPNPAGSCPTHARVERPRAHGYGAGSGNRSAQCPREGSSSGQSDIWLRIQASWRLA